MMLEVHVLKYESPDHIKDDSGERNSGEGGVISYDRAKILSNCFVEENVIAGLCLVLVPCISYATKCDTVKFLHIR